MDELTSFLLQSATGNQWKTLGVRPRHGIALPLSALRTQKSSGIGEYLDLLPLIDWCQELKIDLIQLLPLNDTDNEPSPYNALSSCALHPLFLSLQILPHLEKYPELKQQLSSFASWNETPRIAFHLVLSQKMAWLRSYLQEVGELLRQSPEFTAFVSDNSWLEPYALFKVLKDIHGQIPWKEWPQPHNRLNAEEYAALVKEHSSEISFYILLQFLCFDQMHQVKHYAAIHGVLLKGDLPILISHESADVWHNPHFFGLNLSAGAPPDYLNPDGQNWGFPVFDWHSLKQDNYRWWKQRISYAANFYDLIRIDHAVGFFRIWTIPDNKGSQEGSFLPRDSSIWLNQGRELFQMMIDASPMLPIAEDLGVVSKEVRACLKEMGICGTKVIRWEREWEKNGEYIPLNEYPPISLTTISTHDSETLTLWWRDRKEEPQLFAHFKDWNYSPELSFSQRRELLWDSHHSTSLFHINLLQEYLALFPELIWPNPEDERINIPGKVLPTNWTYRFRPSLEEIITHTPLREAMHQILFSPSPPL